MRKKTYPQKKMTFLSLLLRGLLVTAIICAAFAGALREYILYQIRTQAETQMNERLVKIQQQAGYIDTTSERQFVMNDLHYKITLYTGFNIYIPQLIADNDHSDAIQVTPYYSKNNHAICVLLDENNNIAASNSFTLRTVVRPNEDESESGLYTFDKDALDMPEVSKLFDDIEELYSRCGDTGDIEVSLYSIYFDRSKKIFIPREGKITLLRAKTHREILRESGDMTVEEEREIHIDLEGKGFETMTKNVLGVNPRFSMTILIGVPNSDIKQYGKDLEYCINEKGDINEQFYRRTTGENFTEIIRTLPVYIGGKTYQLYMRFIVDERDPQFVQFYYKWVTIFSAVTLAVTLLLCWRKNVLNKAKYAFEDYQRDLTDHLAHDIKTPLMAISGYAENVLSGKLTEAEQTEYLNSILDNVSFTDSLISRTLYLNHMDSKNTSKETIPLNDMAEDILGKYSLLLHEKKIVYSVSGNAEVHADRTAMETIIENLISNAVKYTPNDSTLRIAIDKKHMTFINSVSEKIDTKELKHPFVRGDAARSNADGSGLGLAIAERAALANGFKLEISCSDTEFKAEVRF